MDELLVSKYQVSSNLSVKLFLYMYLLGGVPSRKRLTTGGTREWLLLSMRTLVALDMFQSMENIRAVSAMESLGPSPAAVPRLAGSS
jgi:hypothetical protein